MAGRFLSEPRLLALAYDLEQELGDRDLPKFLGEVPGPFADAGICAALGSTDAAAGSTDGAAIGRGGGSGVVIRRETPSGHGRPARACDAGGDDRR
jgi:hypothetical protein